MGDTNTDDINVNDTNTDDTDIDDTSINDTCQTSGYPEYAAHTKKYTTLLENYINYTQKSGKIKNGYKKWFFRIIMAIMIALCSIFIWSVYQAFITFDKVSAMQSNVLETVISIVTTVITSFVTMLVSLFELPKVIAKYLFDPEEDKNMTKIIEQIQTYDTSMYSMELEMERSMMRSESTLEQDSVSVSDESVRIPN